MIGLELKFFDTVHKINEENCLNLTNKQTQTYINYITDKIPTKT